MEPGTTFTYRKPDCPFFSVVIASYNPGERILPTVRSVLAQSYREFEVLVVGDGCSDATGEILAANFGEVVRFENLAIVDKFCRTRWGNLHQQILIAPILHDLDERARTLFRRVIGRNAGFIESISRQSHRIAAQPAREHICDAPF